MARTLPLAFVVVEPDHAGRTSESITARVHIEVVVPTNKHAFVSVERPTRRNVKPWFIRTRCRTSHDVQAKSRVASWAVCSIDRVSAFVGDF